MVSMLLIVDVVLVARYAPRDDTSTTTGQRRHKWSMMYGTVVEKIMMMMILSRRLPQDVTRSEGYILEQECRDFHWHG